MGDVSKALSEQYQKLPNKEKKKYEDLYKKETEEYQKELEAWKESNPEAEMTPEQKKAVQQLKK